MRWLIFLALLLSAAFSPVALAQNPVERALRTAKVYWGPSRCQASIVVTESPQVPSAAILGTEVEAWVLFQTPEGFMSWSSPTYSGCTINLSSAVWPSEAVENAAYPEFCQVMVHEYGHFMGWPDSTFYSITDVRYPIQGPQNMPKICLPKLHRAHIKGFER